MSQARRRFKKIKEYIINRDGLNCCYCDKILTMETATLDHIVPDSKNGSFNSTNLTIACAKCNSDRGNALFFEYCKQFNFSSEKIEKYRRLYFSNLKIKVLNIAKEKFLTNEWAVPNTLIKEACKFLKIKRIDFSNYEYIYFFDIKFKVSCYRKDIKRNFEQLIRIIEGEAE